ncbi:MAG TPA: efflux RND transporter permease subunit [Candidatus Limnocylindria bacterium]|nr:efflux RND transporter permease subunit [Candidatus Limnocylindria bacterium]
MRSLPQFAVRHKSFVLAGLVLALFWSAYSAYVMQRREDPLTTQRQTTVVTLFPGATTRDVEQLVTKKIADDLRGVAHVEHVEGISRPGISQVDVVFDDVIHDADPVLRDVRDHLADLHDQLPAGIGEPTLVDDVWKTYPIVVGVTQDGASPRELRDLAKHLADDLSRLPDAGLVKLVGEQVQRVDVALDVPALQRYALGAQDVVGALAARNALVPAGSVALDGRLADVDPADPLRSAADVAATIVRGGDGRPVRVGDVAHVRTAYPDPPDELVRVDGREGIAIAVQAKETSSLTDLGPEVNALLARARASWPAGTHAALIADQPRSVDDRIADFGLNLLLAVVIVTGLVALFMGLRNGILVGVTVVLTIVLTFGVIRLVGVDINQISILALIIALGIVVDTGIVSIDNIEHRLRAGDDRRTAAARGVGDLWMPLLTSTLVAMSSFLPFGLMGGGIGDFVRDLAIVTCASLAVSLAVAYLVTPILGEWFARPAARGAARSPFERVLDVLRARYVPLAQAALRRPRRTALLAVGAVVAAVAWVPHLGLQFFPAADRPQFFISVDAPDGTDIRTTERLVARIETIVRAQPGVTTVGSFVGAGAPRFYYNVVSEQPKPSYAQILVDTSDIASANRLVPLLQTRLRGEIAGARIAVKKLEQGPPVGDPIQLRLQGDDPSALALASTALRAKLAAVPGVVDVRDSLGEPTTTLAARIDRARVAETGASEADVQRLVSLAFGGTTATAIREADRQTPVVVRLPADLRSDAGAFGALAVRTSAGANIPLAELATLAPSTQTSVATYRDGSPTVTVLADVEGRLPSEALADFRRAAAFVALPSGVRLSYAGEDEQTITSFRNLLVAVIVGLLINQMVLLWEFRTLRLSLTVLSAVPLGLVGAVAGLALTGSHFGFVASLGISSLGGIVTNHAIVLFEYAKREMESGHPMERALITAGTTRLRPILLTVVASIAGLLPLAFSSQTLWRPFCWAVIFGLGGSMLMTLIAIPAISRLVAAPARAGAVQGHAPQPISSAVA